MTDLNPLVQVLVFARNRIWLDILPFQGNVDVTFLMQTKEMAKKAGADGHNAIALSDIDLSCCPKWDIVFVPHNFGAPESLHTIEMFCWLYRLTRDLLVIRDNNYDLIAALASIDMRVAIYDQQSNKPYCKLSQYEDMAKTFDIIRFEAHGLLRLFPHYIPDIDIPQRFSFDTDKRDIPQVKRDLEKLDKQIGGIFSNYLLFYYKKYSQNVREAIDIKESAELIRLSDSSGAVFETEQCTLSPQKDFAELPLEQWKDAVVKQQTARFIIHPQASVTRPHNINTGEEDSPLSRFLELWDIPYTAAQQELYYLPNAKISGHSLHVYDKQNRLVPETEYLNTNSQYWNHAPETNCVRFPAVAHRLDAPRTSLILFNTCYRDYFHWHIDALPAIMHARKLGLEDICVVTRSLAPWQKASLDLFGIEKYVELRQGHYTIDDVFYPTVLRGEAFTPHPTILDGYNAIKKTVAECIDSQKVSAQYGTRFYVSRRDAERRVIVNENDFATAMEKRGFTIIAPGELPYIEQVQAFSKAEIVVGSHGAGLTNIVYADNLRLLFEIFPEQYLNPCFIRLANLKGAATAQAAYPSEDAHMVDFIHKLTWKIDVDDVLKRIDAVLEKIES